MSALDTGSKLRPRWSARLAAIRGVAIVLVILGHLRPAEGSEVWLAVRRVIFDLHVPIFFVVSGVLWGLKGLDGRQASGLRWVPRLVVPFVAFTAIPLIGIALAGLWPEVAAALPALTAGRVLSHLRNPQTGGFAVHLWFLVALAVVKLVYPRLRALIRSDALTVLAVVALSLAPWPGDGCLNLAALYLPLYAVGAMIGRARLHERMDLPRAWWAAAASGLFAAFFVLPRVGPVRLVLGLCGAVVIATALGDGRGPAHRALEALGDRSLELYLLHPLFIPAALAAAAAVGEGVLSWPVWLASGTVVVALTYALARGLERVAWIGALLFGAPPPGVSAGNSAVRSPGLDRLPS